MPGVSPSLSVQSRGVVPGTTHAPATHEENPQRSSGLQGFSFCYCDPLEPGVPDVSKERQCLRHLGGVTRRPRGADILLGDWNFVAAGESRERLAASGVGEDACGGWRGPWRPGPARAITEQLRRSSRCRIFCPEGEPSAFVNNYSNPRARGFAHSVALHVAPLEH